MEVTSIETLVPAVQGLARDLEPALIELRRAIHAHPEIGYNEVQTAKRIAETLRNGGLEVQEGVAQTGVVGLVRGGADRPTIGFRAELDALSIQEENDLSYASTEPGIMHACGHDANMAMSVGAALILSSLQDRMQGNAKFLFQPSEESPPGGALAMIKEGVLENPQVDAIISPHVHPGFPAGEIALKAGRMNAASDDLEIEVVGEAGHGASPHLGRDAIVAASQVVLGLQTIVSRRSDPTLPVVITIGTIQGGQRSNVIADRVTMTGTLRTHDDSLRARLPDLIQEVADHLARGAGARATAKVHQGYPTGANDPALIGLLDKAGRLVLGAESVTHFPEPSMGGDDFAYFGQRIPASACRVGVRNESEQCVYPMHHPRFNVDESVLKLGAALMATTALMFFQARQVKSPA